MTSRNYKRDKKSPKNLRLYRFARYILHPLRWTGMLAVLWLVPGILVMYFMHVNTNFDKFALFIELPPSILTGLHGFYMVKRDEYIQRTGGNIAYGFPAKPFGYFFMIFGWGWSLFLIASVIFHWS